MSKTSELVERYAVDELKAQIAEANSNPYLGIYGIVLGLIIANAGYITNAFREIYRANAWYYTFWYVAALFISLSAAIFLIVIQASGMCAKDAHLSELDQKAYRFATEERANLLGNITDEEQIERIDLQISENVRHRLIEVVLEISKGYRKVNIEKAWSQRITAICLFAAVLLVFSAFILAIGDYKSIQEEFVVNTDIGKAH